MFFSGVIGVLGYTNDVGIMVVVLGNISMAERRNWAGLGIRNAV